MARSAWKGPFGQNNNNKKIFFTRTVTIVPAFISNRYKIYNGLNFFSIKITSSMIGFKLGAFALTRKKFYYKRKNV
jgi:ribosomal protein S19